MRGEDTLTARHHVVRDYFRPNAVLEFLHHRLCVSGRQRERQQMKRIWRLYIYTGTRCGLVVLLAYHGRDVHRPDEVALRAYGHVCLEYVGLGVDRGHLGAVVQEDHFLHGPVLSVGMEMIYYGRCRCLAVLYFISIQCIELTIHTLVTIEQVIVITLLIGLY